MKWKVVIVVCAVVASGAVCAVMKRRETAELNALAQSRRSMAEALASLRAENEQMAALVEKAPPGDGLSRGQLVELMRLRASVGKLRETVAEKPRVEADNKHWRDAAAKKRQHEANAEALPNYWAKERLAFSGWATPETAMQSLLWGMKNGDAHSWQAACTPEALAGLAKELGRSGKSPEEQEAAMENMGREMVAAAAGFHIVGQQTVGADQAVVDLSFDGEDAVRSFSFKKIGNDWKFDNVLAAGASRASKEGRAAIR